MTSRGPFHPKVFYSFTASNMFKKKISLKTCGYILSQSDGTAQMFS